MMLADLINALKSGQELKDPAKWKKNQWFMNTVTAFVAAVVGLVRWKFPDIHISDEVVSFLGQLVMYVLLIANAYLIPATSTKVGIKKKLSP